MATNTMDDPWNWSVIRVCQELTTTQRSWQPGTTSSLNLQKLRKRLEQNVVNGKVLLTGIKHNKDVSDVFDVHCLNHQSWLLAAIRQLRSRSPQYLSQYTAPDSEEQAKSESTRCLAELRGYLLDLIRTVDDRLPQGLQMSSLQPHTLPEVALPPYPAMSQPTPDPHLPIFSGSGAYSSQGTSTVLRDCAETNKLSIEPAVKRPEVKDINSTEKLPIQVEDESTSQDIGAPESTSQDSHGSNLESGGIDLSTDLINPMVPDDEAALSVPQVESEDPTPATTPQQEVNPVPVMKQPKRLAFGLLTTVSDIDVSRNRELPTYEDEILGLKIPDPSLAGRKIVAPQLIDRETIFNPVRVDSEDEDSIDLGAAPQLQIDNSFQGRASDAQSVPAVNTPSRHPRSRRHRPARYLAKGKLSVDDIFYEGVAIGSDLPISTIEPEDQYFSHTNTVRLPTGQVRYVHRTVRNFMLSKQDLNRTRRAVGPHFSSQLLAIDLQRTINGAPIPEVTRALSVHANVKSVPFGKGPKEELARETASSTSSQHTSQHERDLELFHDASESVERDVEEHGLDVEKHTFTAVRTYHEDNGSSGLMTWLTTPSFSLYYRDSTGQVRARREKLVDWPELLGGKDPKEYSALTPLQLIGMRQADPPEYYEHWDNKPSKEIAEWGKSGSEGEYDTETWKEILRERGERSRRRTRQRGSVLTPAQITDVLDQAIRAMIEKWNVFQLPKHQKGALRVWKKGGDKRTRRTQIQAIQDKLQAFETRITNIRAEFATIRWTSWSQALRGCRNLEPTVFDRETLKWKWDILAEENAPDAPDTQPKTAGKSKKTAVSPAADEVNDDVDNGDNSRAQEVYDADDLGDFIVADDEADEEGEGVMIEDMEDSDVELDGDDRLTKSPSTDQTDLDSRTPLRKSAIVKRTSEVIDLTDSPPTSDNFADIIDLTTPSKKTTASKGKGTKSNAVTGDINYLLASLGSGNHLPPYDKPLAIADFSYEYWEKYFDRIRLMIKFFYELKDSRFLLHFFKRYSKSELWDCTQIVNTALHAKADHAIGMKTSTFDHLTQIIEVLHMYIECKYYPWGRKIDYAMHKTFTESRNDWFSDFYDVCSRIDGFLTAPPLSVPQSPAPLVHQVNKRHFIEIDDDDDEEPTKRRRIRGSPDNDEDDEDFTEFMPSPSSTRKRPVIEDANARAARDRNKERLSEQELRRSRLRAKLAESGITLGQGQTKHMINDAAALDQGPVFVNEEIGRRIKQHQVDGVRFMWNQVVAVTDEHSLQGCLLAHTMGLGKTMQVITLLVAIAEASSSPDVSVSSQIPTSLRGKLRTLVLCPPGLVDNWMDELLFWTPGHLLGDFWKLSNLPELEGRLQCISDWHENGGVLIIGYEMLRNLIQNKSTKKREEPLTPQGLARLREHLLDGPDIVIADEAHKLKNSKANIAIVASQLRTKCRIALTGSPLANNVEEYYSMIEFVQPGYLGSAVEFRSKFKEPIEAGMFSDSDPSQIRQARKMLTVLNEELALKVQRADLSVLKNDLPLKKEFVISVPLTELQRTVYSLYVQSLKVLDHEVTKDGEVKQTTIWSWLAMLSLLCNHPSCFNAKIHERKDAKQSTPGSPAEDDVTTQSIDIYASKARLLPAFVEEVTRLFQAEDLTQVNLSNKVKVLCQILDAAKEAGDKTLVFSSSIPTLDFLETLLRQQGRSLARLDGRTTMGKRQGIVKDYNFGSTEVFLISTTAGGLGLNLQSANRVVIFDFKYNPIQEEQAVGRAYRIGQLKPTFVYRFVCGGTFEDNIHNKTLFKSQLASRVVDKKRVQPLAKKKFGDFLFEPKSLPQKDLSEFQGMDPAVLDRILALQAETATIMSIVQTDSFAVDEEYDIPPEDIMEVSRVRGEMNLQRQADKAAAQLPKLPLTRDSPSTVQASRRIESATSHTQSSGPTTPKNAKTPILPPPPRYFQGFSGAQFSQTGQGSSGGSGRDSSARFSHPPIMGAGGRFEADPSNSFGRAANDNGNGVDQSKPSKTNAGFFSLLLNAYQPSISGASSNRQLPAETFSRTKSISKDIEAVIKKRFPDAAHYELYTDMAYDSLRADHQQGQQIIDSKLSVEAFVDRLVRGGANTEKLALYHAMNSQFSSTRNQGSKMPVKESQDRTATGNMRDEDAGTMVEIDRERKARVPSSKSSEQPEMKSKA